jgi:proteic killer suppression protein
MKIQFSDSQGLSRYDTPEASQIKLPVEVISTLRNKLHAIKSMTDERDLRNWKSLHYERLTGNLKGKRSIRLNKKWRLVFSIDNDTQPPVIQIESVEDYH